ncbi:hypothetical protein SNOG_10774 [Parastagonospora nodorum SN15]|uniref:Uncharacterized protein n=1 Tax=Phaeosphaeria nodorum (strain SN15 / ATCC MYA-4574 / FGSC 10173) TaxID=321614 RepID=Q0UBU0_PHANO|nr:hypothetical protein SNOG_10774 [Parastagonospora nodorum SN15]EAT82168.2 hypothetical protein SNOG_10774 [Parastagonospora nodorum SN15]
MSTPRNSQTTARPAYAPLQTTCLAQTSQPRHQPQRHPSFEYRPNREGAGQTAAETTNYLSQMALLNEAAKRAQMACVMRDIGEMEL